MTETYVRESSANEHDVKPQEAQNHLVPLVVQLQKGISIFKKEAGQTLCFALVTSSRNSNRDHFGRDLEVYLINIEGRSYRCVI